MFIVYIHKLILPRTPQDTFATVQVLFGAQKMTSRIVLPLSPEYSEYNMYNERFVFEDASASPHGFPYSPLSGPTDRQSVSLSDAVHGGNRGQNEKKK
jgi:hypothetical protein